MPCDVYDRPIDPYYLIQAVRGEPVTTIRHHAHRQAHPPRMIEWIGKVLIPAAVRGVTEYVWINMRASLDDTGEMIPDSYQLAPASAGRLQELGQDWAWLHRWAEEIAEELIDARWYDIADAIRRDAESIDLPVIRHPD
jgi:hypothetical protein